jgi:hypothetical protein
MPSHLARDCTRASKAKENEDRSTDTDDLFVGESADALLHLAFEAVVMLSIMS